MDMPSGATSASPNPASIAMQPDTAPASPVSGIDWSIFNHHGAGLFIFLWGITALIAGLQYPKRTWFRFVPPFMLFGLAEFLFLRNDPKAWPTGPIGFWVSFQDPAVLQHRIFVLLILTIGVVELLRAAGRLPPLLQRFALPGLAAFGSIFLFFHTHGGLATQQMMRQLTDPRDPGMVLGSDVRSMAATMAIVRREHLLFSLCGFGLAAAKLLADGGVLKGRLGATLWSLFAIALGAYMLVYTE